MSFWPASCHAVLRPLKRVCRMNPDVLSEQTDPGYEFEYIDIGSVSPEYGVVYTERMRFNDSPSRARKPVQGGDVIVSTVRTYLKAVAYTVASDVPQIASTGFAVLRAKPGIEPRFLYRVVQSNPFVEAVVSRSTGVSYPAINPSDMGRIPIPLPDLGTQRAIAEFLDRETARIDQLIEKKEQFLSFASLRIEALVATAISDPNVTRIRFGNAARRVSRPVSLSEHDQLVRLGLFNRGRGIFKKPAADEEGMGASSFYFVESGDLILSGQFAWEGAVALASDEEEGCVVSHRYPIYQGIAGVSTAYLLALFRSKFGDFILNDASRGSAGRNRPLNTWRLEKEKIPVADQGLQSEVQRAILFERRLKKITEVSIERLREFRSALITAAVTGQIDVSSWGKQGSTDRRLDQIEKEMAS